MLALQRSGKQADAQAAFRDHSQTPRSSQPDWYSRYPGAALTLCAPVMLTHDIRHAC
jgi:hypothetical protein